MESTYYYVTAKRDSQTAYLVGPCRSHELALSLVEPVTRKSYEVDPFSAFYTFGTASVTWNHKTWLPDGRLNKLIGFDEETQSIQ